MDTNSNEEEIKTEGVVEEAPVTEASVVEEVTEETSAPAEAPAN